MTQNPEPEFIALLREMVEERRSAPGRCACFGDSGFQASTHFDRDDVERCDLCSLPCGSADDWSIPAPVAGAAFGALVGLSLLSVAAALWTSRAARRRAADRKA